MPTLKAENLIISGKFLIPWSKKVKNKDDEKILVHVYSSVKKQIIGVMTRRKFRELHDADLDLILSWYFRDDSALPNTLEFIAVNERELEEVKLPLSLQLRKLFRLISERDIKLWKYYYVLEETKNSYPWKVKIRTKPTNVGVLLEVEIYPAMYFKITQMNYKPYLSDFDYTALINEGISFLRDIMAELFAQEIEAPHPLGSFVEKSILGKLEKFGFSQTRALLEKAIEKIDTGQIEDGLTDLRSALEKFIEILVEQSGRKPVKGFKNNLNILLSAKAGHLETQMAEFIEDTVYEWLYRYLSNKAVHERERISIDDAKFIFNVTCDVIDHLIDKVILRR